MSSPTSTIVTAQLKFEYVREIGQNGQNSEVWLATDKQLNTEIVVKKVTKASFANATTFYGEVQKLSLSQHPNVVEVKYACEDSEYIYFSMPFYRRGSIKELIESRFLTTREIVRYSIQFLSGLYNIHTKGLIHFDIKPDNVMISDSNTALISDFGLTEAMSATGFARQDFAYTVHTPPERFQQSSHTVLYDIYQAGLTIYRMCNGNQVFRNQLPPSGTVGDLRALIEAGNFPQRDVFLPHIPKKLRKIIKGMLFVDQNRRYQTVLDVMNDLSKLDEMLDWKYEAAGGVLTWTLQKGNQLITVRVERSATSAFNMTTTKRNTDTHRELNVRAHCYTNKSSTEVNALVMSALEDLK